MLRLRPRASTLVDSHRRVKLSGSTLSYRVACISTGAPGRSFWSLPTALTTARVMLPEHANPAGRVHGGEILRLIDEAGVIAALRQFVSKETSPTESAQSQKSPGSAALARIDRMDFQEPMSIGDLAVVSAKPTFVSKNSLEVEVKVEAEDLATGVRRTTNSARCWYVRVENHAAESYVDSVSKPVLPKLIPYKGDPIPQIQGISPAQLAAGEARYAAQRAARTGPLEALATTRRADMRPVSSTMVLPSDCYANGLIFGGTVMKLMDSSSAVVAIQYCGTNVVTASIDALNFIAPIKVGNLLRVYATPTFSSAKSLEVTCHVESEDIFSGLSWRCVSAHLTFVSLDANLKSLPIRPVSQLSHEAREDFAKGAERYRLRRAARAAASAAS